MFMTVNQRVAGSSRADLFGIYPQKVVLQHADLFGKKSWLNLAL